MKKLTLASVIVATMSSPFALANDDAGCLKVVSESDRARFTLSCSSAKGAEAELSGFTSFGPTGYSRDDRRRASVSPTRGDSGISVRPLRSFDSDIDQPLLDELIAYYQENGIEGGEEATPTDDTTSSETTTSSNSGVSESSNSVTITATASPGETPTIGIEQTASGNTSTEINATASNGETTVTATESSETVSTAPVKPTPAVPSSTNGVTESTNSVTVTSTASQGETPTIDIEQIASGNTSTETNATASNGETTVTKTISESNIDPVDAPDADADNTAVSKVTAAATAPADGTPVVDIDIVGEGFAEGVASNENGTTELDQKSPSE